MVPKYMVKLCKLYKSTPFIHRYDSLAIELTKDSLFISHLNIKCIKSKNRHMILNFFKKENDNKLYLKLQYIILQQRNLMVNKLFSAFSLQKRYKMSKSIMLNSTSHTQKKK